MNRLSEFVNKHKYAVAASCTVALSPLVSVVSMASGSSGDSGDVATGIAPIFTSLGDMADQLGVALIAFVGVAIGGAGIYFVGKIAIRAGMSVIKMIFK